MKELKDLVVGDKVIVTLQQFTITKVFVGKVERLTKTLIIVNGIKFRRSDGIRVADTYGYCDIKVASEDEIKKVEEEADRLRLAKNLREYNYYSLPLEKLKKIIHFIKE